MLYIGLIMIIIYMYYIYRREASIGLIVTYVIYMYRMAKLLSTSPAGKVMWQ